ncbi:Rieske (2Fe-2S) protein [Streptomyces sp. NPDC046716]|uniref:Rieske (2Fe-2S) protein n=1 Tax=Streptomyces sp. NPDC046716 TaxID=3157093 RepID=UPI0033F19A1B
MTTSRRAASRRSVLVAGAAALAAGCSKYGDESGGGSGGTRTARTSPPAEASPRSSSPVVLAKTSDIPVGGGRVFAAEKVVVTQPAQGDFKAFSAICTHEGCTVNRVAGGTIDCPCHGSKYRIADASVAAGPAPRPLPPRRIGVSGNSITLG